MAQPARAKTSKGINGTGDSVTVYFDPSDPAERKALEAARLLASKHGRRKQAIVALLEAVYNVYEASGELLSATEISAALLGQGSTVPPQQSRLVSTDITSDKRGTQLKHGDGSPLVEITGSTGKASAEMVGANFLKSVSGLSGGFFD